MKIDLKTNFSFPYRQTKTD